MAASQRKTSKVHAASAALLDLSGKRIATVTMVVADEVPEVVMFEGNPFILTVDLKNPDLAYQQVKPYRADALVIEEPA